MEGLFEAIFFWVFAAGLIGSALAVLLNRNPVASALSLVATFLFLAFLFITLEAYFIAAVQVIVYAGAVMVLFLFIIMLLDLKEEVKRSIQWGRLSLVAIIGVLLAGVFCKVLSGVDGGEAKLKWGEVGDSLGAKELGVGLFSQYVLPFEMTAVLLLMATIGVILLSRRVSK